MTLPNIVRKTVKSLSSAFGSNHKSAPAAAAAAATAGTEGLSDEQKEKIAQYDQDVATLQAYDAFQRRTIYLHETDHIRVRMQNEMFWIVFMVILAMVVFMLLHRAVPLLFPLGVYMVLELTVIGVGAIYTYIKYRDYVRRDAVRFDQVDLAPPDMAGEKSDDVLAARKKAAQLSGDLTTGSALQQCVGAACCDGTYTVYSATLGKCVKK